MSDPVPTINPEQFPDSPILEACKTPEVYSIISASLKERIDRLKSQEPIEPMTDASFELQDLLALQEALKPDPDETEKAYVPYRYIQDRDGSLTTSVVNAKDLDRSGKVFISNDTSTFNPIHILEITETMKEERRPVNPADEVIRKPIKRISLSDVHLYRGHHGQVLRRPSVGLALEVFADGSIEATQMFVGADRRQYEDPKSKRATESNHPASKILQ